jgi:hypothetical protein
MHYVILSVIGYVIYSISIYIPSPPLYLRTSSLYGFISTYIRYRGCRNALKVGENGPPHTKRRFGVTSPKDSHSDNTVSMVEQGKPVSKALQI